MPAHPPLSTGRLLELDALRGLAAVAVVLFHFTTRFQELFGHSERLALSVPWGDYGVDLFFMLSGFVILMTLDRTSSSLKFAWGRFSRLYPTYWAAAGLTFLVVCLCGLPGQEVSTSEALVNVTMVQSLLGCGHIDGAYWSLQAELIFYANMLLLYRCGAFRQPALAVTGWIALACGVHALHALASAATWPVAASLLSKLATVTSVWFIPYFGIGILLYSLRRSANTLSRWNRYQHYFALAACLVAADFLESNTTLLLDALLALLLGLAVNGRLTWLAAKPLVWLGAISYSLYLSHQNIGYVIIRHLESEGVSPLASIAVACAAALALATCLHYTVERTSMRLLRNVDLAALRRLLFPPRSGQTAETHR
jgi:peptidoglycan/LPS O-acetylase OafA/YrhL